MITLGYAIPVLAQYCGSGKSPDNPTVADDINMAIEVLMNKPKLWSHTVQNLIFCAPNGQLTLPREVLKIIKCRINGAFVDVQSPWYEYMSNGPGLKEYDNSHWCSPPADRGFACTQYDIPPGQAMYLSVVSDRDEDEGAKILFRGHDETKREIRSGRMFGQYVPIQGGSAEKMWISESLFSDISSIEKPVTNGYVYISAMLPATGERYFLGSIHPDETKPSYRRYFVNETPACDDCTGTSCTTAGGTIVAPTPYRIDAICKMRYVPATHDSDVLLIQNIGAIKMMLKALRLEDAEQLEAAAGYEASAERRMNEMTANAENDETALDINPSGNIGDIEEV